jgi:hypothetical protein
MNQLKTLAVACTLGAAMLLGGKAQADVAFTYDWSPSVPSVSGDKGFNALDFSNQGPVSLTTSQAVGNASSLSVHNGTSDTFTSSGFSLTVKITDGANSGTVQFTGQLNGTITNGTPNNLSATYLSATTQPLTLGNDSFVVKMTGFVPPNSFGAANKPGGFGFEIDATAGNNGGTKPPPNDTPEPSTMLLSVLGLAGAGLGAWKKRQQARA